MVELKYEFKVLSQKEIDEKTGYIVTSYAIDGISGPTYEQLSQYLKEEPSKLFRRLVYQQGPNLILRTENEMVILISNEMKSSEKQVFMDMISKIEQYCAEFKEKFKTEMNRLKIVRDRAKASKQKLDKMSDKTRMQVQSFEF